LKASSQWPLNSRYAFSIGSLLSTSWSIGPRRIDIKISERSARVRRTRPPQRKRAEDDREDDLEGAMAGETCVATAPPR
jgi:hypothetical protein